MPDNAEQKAKDQVTVAFMTLTEMQANVVAAQKQLDAAQANYLAVIKGKKGSRG